MDCDRYHGIAYGQTLATRTPLVCGFHPYGWLDASPCPDWQEKGNLFYYSEFR